MPYKFNGNNTHTLGVEVEFQLVDTRSYKLSNSISSLLERVPDKWKNQIKHEFMQNNCEFNTTVCNTVAEVEADLHEKIEWASDLLEQEEKALLWGGSHPFSPWYEQVMTPDKRYEWLRDAMQDVAKRICVFGLHVHVGVNSGDKAIQLCDRLLRHLPTLLALSANSPLWNGRDTGLESYRSKIMDALPTAGMPETMRNWSEYVWLVDHLVSTGFIRSIREIWWDVRPHHEFGTVEIRVMDMPYNMEHLRALVALTQSLVAALSHLIDRGAYQYDCHPMIAKQNKWQAARYGLDASFVDPDTMQAVPAKKVVNHLVELCSPYAEKLGCIAELNLIDNILTGGNGASKQLEVYEKTHDAVAVARLLTERVPDSSPATA